MLQASRRGVPYLVSVSAMYDSTGQRSVGTETLLIYVDLLKSSLRTVL